MIANLTRWLVLISLLALPWPNGGVDPIPRIVVAVLAAVIAFGSIFVKFPGSNRLSSVLIPLVMGAVLIACHLLPINRIDAPTFNTEAFRFRSELMPAWLLEQNQATVFPHSLNPAGTRFDLANYSIALTCFLGGYLLFQGRRNFWSLSLFLASVGAAVSVFGIAHRLSGSRDLYWSFKLERSTVFGPFVYHNLAGNFLMMAAGASFALLIREIAIKHTSQESLKDASLRFLGDLSFHRMFLMTLATFNFAGLFFTLSRGAIVASAVAGIVVFAISVSRQTARLTIVVTLLLVLTTGGLFIAYDLNAPVVDRLSTLLEDETYEQEGRLVHWPTAFGCIRRFGLVGSGFGTYRYVYRTAQETAFPKQWDHAHNQYIEAIVDGGIPGIAAMTMAIVLVLFACSRLIKGSSPSIGRLAVFVVVAQIVHAVFDYVLYLPASFIPFALLCGSACGVAMRHGSEDKIGFRFPLRPVLAVLVFGFAAWSAFEIYVSEHAKYVIHQLPWRADVRDLELSDLDNQIEALETRLELRPDDADLLTVLTELYSVRYRISLLNFLSEESKIPKTDDNLWQWTAPIVLHDRAHAFLRANKKLEFDDLVQQDLVVENLRPVVKYATSTLVHCPIISESYLHLERTGFLLDPPVVDEELLNRFTRLEPGHAGVLHEVGKLALSAGRNQQALELWKRSLQASGEHLDSIFVHAVQLAKPEELATNLLDNNTTYLVKIAQAFHTEEGINERNFFLDRAENILDSKEEKTADDLFDLGGIAMLRTPPNLELAITRFRGGLSQEPTNVEARYEFASILFQADLLDEAKLHATMCLRARPRRRLYRTFIQSIQNRATELKLNKSEETKSEETKPE